MAPTRSVGPPPSRKSFRAASSLGDFIADSSTLLAVWTDDGMAPEPRSLLGLRVRDARVAGIVAAEGRSIRSPTLRIQLDDGTTLSRPLPWVMEHLEQHVPSPAGKPGGLERVMAGAKRRSSGGFYSPSFLSPMCATPGLSGKRTPSSRPRSVTWAPGTRSPPPSRERLHRQARAAADAMLEG